MKEFRRPNILLLYTDQQRRDSLRCYGNPFAQSPNLNRLAAEGVRLENYFINSPVCMPSRMSFLTGRYCSSLGVGCNGIPFPDSALPLQSLLKPYGYECVQIGKLHFQPHAKRDHRDPHPLYGFDRLILSDEPGCYDDAYVKWVREIAPEQVPLVRSQLPPAAAGTGKPAYEAPERNTHQPYLFKGDEELTHSAFVASETSRYLRSRGESGNRENRPFFAAAGFYAPHTPVNPPKRFVDAFRQEEAPLPRRSEEEVLCPQLEGYTRADYRKMVTYYHALCAHVDDCIGRILDTLDDCGLRENTIVVFTSDHGEYLGDHGRIQKGMPGHDCISRVPFLIRYPAKIDAACGGSGKTIDDICEGVDFVPTILDYAGIQIPRFVQGRSLRGLFSEKDRLPEANESALIELFFPFGVRETAVRTSRFLYYLSSSGKEILYDVERDPSMLHNAASKKDYSEVLLGLRKEMLKKLFIACMSTADRPAEY